MPTRPAPPSLENLACICCVHLTWREVLMSHKRYDAWQRCDEQNCMAKLCHSCHADRVAGRPTGLLSNGEEA